MSGTLKNVNEECDYGPCMYRVVTYMINKQNAVALILANLGRFALFVQVHIAA